MAQELVYTSAPEGLRGGSGGFCTVAYTEKMPLDFVLLLESLSSYKPAFPVHDPRSQFNPVAFTHFIYTIKLQKYSLLSRVSSTSADHTKRDNKLAHHIVLSRRDQVVAGPGALMIEPDMFLCEWNSKPTFLKERVIENIPVSKNLYAKTWQQVAGDAGWAGILAKSYLERPQTPSYIIYPAGTPTEVLFSEAIALLPIEHKWRVTYSTYFFFAPAGSTCIWRGCIEGSDAAKEAKRQPRCLIIDLTQPLPTITEKHNLIECARLESATLNDFGGRKVMDSARTQRLPMFEQPQSNTTPPIPNNTVKVLSNEDRHKRLEGRNQGFLTRWKDN